MLISKKKKNCENFISVHELNLSEDWDGQRYIAIKWESAIALHKPAYWVNIKSLPKSYIKGVIKKLAFKNITQKCEESWDGCFWIQDSAKPDKFLKSYGF